MLNGYGETHIVFCKEFLWHPKNYNIYHVQFFRKFWTNKATLIPVYSYQIIYSSGDSFLYIGTTFAIFKASGTIPSVNDLLNISFNGYTISDAITFTKSDFTRSWPGLFLLPRFLMIFNISLSSVGLKKQVEVQLLPRYSSKSLPWCLIVPANVGPMLIKKIIEFVCNFFRLSICFIVVTYKCLTLYIFRTSEYWVKDFPRIPHVVSFFIQLRTEIIFVSLALVRSLAYCDTFYIYIHLFQ